MKFYRALLKGYFFSPSKAPLFLFILLLSAGCAQVNKPAEPFSKTEESRPDSPIKPTPEPALSPSPPAPARTPASPDQNFGDYLISSGDLLDISVLGEEDLSLKVRVAENGVISYPLLGEVTAGGYTHLELERKLEELLNRDYLVSPSVSISILEYSTISVLGQVKKPGAYEIKGRLSVTAAIAMSGGLSDVASPNGTKVIRKINGHKKVIEVRVKDILQDGDLEDNIYLKPGDIVFVPESFF